MERFFLLVWQVLCSFQRDYFICVPVFEFSGLLVWLVLCSFFRDLYH